MNKKFIVDGKAGDLSPNQVYVKQGDTLSKIAKELTGNINNWREIAEASGIKDPNNIKPGQVITIPSKVYNPMVTIGKESHRLKSPEYRKVYQESIRNNPTAPDRLAAYKQSQASKGAEVVRTAIDNTGREIVSTGLNALDLPRRIVASATNKDYSLGEAINIIGNQPYKSVVGDEYATKHPYVAMGADIGTGLMAWNLPGVTKAIVGTGLNLARSEAAIARAVDAAKQLSGAPPKVLKSAAKQSRQNTAKTIASNPNKYETLVIFPDGSTGTSSAKTLSATKINSTPGARLDPRRGLGKTGWKTSRTPVDRGTSSGAYVPGREHVGGLHYPIPLAPIVKPPFIPIPGIPAYPTKPPIVPTPVTRERIEQVQPGQFTLTDIINKYKAQPGDTLEFPSGEQIIYKRGNSPIERVFDVNTTKVYDVANTPREQYYIPGRTELQWKGAAPSVGKYVPGVPTQEIRNREIYYPSLVGGVSTQKPLK